MNIYNYDGITGEFIGDSVAQLDPLDKKPMIPSFATDVEPPDFGLNSIPVWENNTWKIVPDYRGHVSYDQIGDEHKIEEINKLPNPDFATTKKPAQYYDLVSGQWAVNNSKFLEYKEQQLDTEVQERLDNFARTRQYRDMDRLCTYVSSTNTTWASEASRGIKLRDDTWVAAGIILDEVLAGTRPVPDSIKDIEAELPILTWE